MTLFAEIKTLTSRGFWADEIRIDRILVEAKRCPKCRKPLAYQAFSNRSETQTFGVCEKCEYAAQFWLDGVRFAAAKKEFSARS